MHPGPGAGEIGLGMSTPTPSVSRRRVRDRALAQRREDRLRQRYGLLLGALVVSFAVQGIVPGGDWQEVLVTALVGTTLVLALRAGEVDPHLVAGAAAVAGILLVLVAVSAATGHASDQVARLADGLLVVLAPPAVVLGVLRGVRQRGVTVQAVLGVLCVYLLIGMLCASVFGAIDRVGGQPFFADGIAATTSNCLYFSFTTLTTVGYGDLTARTNLGHTLAVSEALVGQIYLVTVVALLVANLGRARGGDAER
jgi:ion channel